jgi:hypothetical protein
MPRSQSPLQPSRRRGVILLVVLALLTLFATIGLTFVLYADAEATAARIAREAESQTAPNVDPELLLAYFLGQLIYDVDDTRGVYSALRGHSLARLMYGYHAEGTDTQPFNGTGRLHSGPGTYMNPFQIDDYLLVNYTFFPGDGFLRDPERLGRRADPSQPVGPFTGGFNPSYTYPDLNNMFLAAVRADGTVLMPSFHRPWTGFGSLDPSNPNWYNRSEPWRKYQVLRPRPVDMGPEFPVPEPGGDVKNLVAAPGGNDSIWLDLDFPVLRAPNGRKYKPLFAPLIVDLDNRININVHGNIRGRGRTHGSNQGLGPWEVNLGRVLTKGDNELSNLFAGRPGSIRLGRYGRDQQPAVAGSVEQAGLLPHVYAQTDFDASQERAGYEPTLPFQLPSPALLPWSSFPLYPSGYGNGSSAERTNHPLIAANNRPVGDDRSFAVCNMEALLRPDDIGSSALISEPAIICPQNFADPRIRRLVTTHSFDLDFLGIAPWLFDRDNSGYQLPLGATGQPPVGPAIPFPDLSLRTTTPIPAESDFQVPGADPTHLLVDWRSWAGVLGCVDLNRFLPPYPHQGQGLDPATWSAKPLVGLDTRFDTDPAVSAQCLAAQTARQQLADEIYRRLLVVTSVAAPANPSRPSDADLAPRRWLAQLAVNIVDFLDEDDISTPFTFYTSQDAGDSRFDAGAVSAGNPNCRATGCLGPSCRGLCSMRCWQNISCRASRLRARSMSRCGPSCSIRCPLAHLPSKFSRSMPNPFHCTWLEREERRGTLPISWSSPTPTPVPAVHFFLGRAITTMCSAFPMWHDRPPRTPILPTLSARLEIRRHSFPRSSRLRVSFFLGHRISMPEQPSLRRWYLREPLFCARQI